MNTTSVIVILIIVFSEGYVGPVSGENSDILHYSRTLIESIIDICAGNSSIIRHTNTAEAPNSRITTNQTRPTLVPVYIYPYILLALWIVCISAIICCCLYCKCQQAEIMTAHNTNSLELQEVHIVDHPKHHVKGCVCLYCLQRQVAQEVLQK